MLRRSNTNGRLHLLRNGNTNRQEAAPAAAERHHFGPVRWHEQPRLTSQLGIAGHLRSVCPNGYDGGVQEQRAAPAQVLELPPVQVKGQELFGIMCPCDLPP